MRPVLVLSFVATVVLLVAGDNPTALLVGRLLAGIASGAAFAPGTAWVKELSTDRPGGTGARRATLLFGIVLTAPWVFGAAATSFTTIPSFVDIGLAPVAVIGALTGLTLWTGVAIQPVGKRIGDARLIIVSGLAAAAGGLLVGLLLSATGDGWLVLPAAVLLGTAYGLVLVGGLTIVEQIAAPDDLGTLNAIFYSLTYVGFAAPLLSTMSLRTLTPEALMLLGIGMLVLAAPLVLLSGERAVVTRR